MWQYWMLFIVFAVVAMAQLRPVPPSQPLAINVLELLPVLRRWGPTFVLITLIVGMRHEVGADWTSYLGHLEEVPVSLADALAESDPSYGLLNWIAAELSLGVHFVNSVCAVIFAGGLLAFCRRQPLPWLALVVAVPYLVIVVAMGYTRQGVAIGLAMLGLAALDQGRVMRFVIWLALAATFHKSAVILLPLVALGGGQRRLWVLLLAGMVTFLLFIFLLQESVEGLRVTYIDVAYQSSGAAIRVVMNVLPAVIFLLLRKRFQLLPAQKTFWTWIALGAILFVGLLYVSPSSTAVDRLALYWIPLQLFVLSRLPAALGQIDLANRWLVYSVVMYSAVVMAVWLTFAETAFTWLPYQFYPWVLWQQ